MIPPTASGPGSSGPRPPGGRRFGPYQLLEPIAEGGQGAVYRARHTQIGSLVALKLLHDDTPTVVKRFQQEAQVLGRLSHPHLPRVADLGIAMGRPYLAMELVDGEDLGDLVKRQGLPDAERIATLLAPIADALHYCHGAGVVHRDLKPSNVLIERGSQRPVLADFGLIKLAEDSTLSDLQRSRLSVTGETMGTPAFMAPEQADAETYGQVGPHTDVYALGATLFHLLTGRPPYEGTTSYNIMVKLMQGKAPHPQKVRPEADAELSELCSRCLEHDPQARPPSAAAVAEALRARLAGRETGRAGAALPILGALVLVSVGAVAAAFVLRSSAPPSPDVPPVATPDVEPDVVPDSDDDPEDPPAASEPIAWALDVGFPATATLLGADGSPVLAGDGRLLEEVRIPLTTTLLPGRYTAVVSSPNHAQAEAQLDLPADGEPPRLPIPPLERVDLGGPLDSVRVGDVDGDGLLDLLVLIYTGGGRTDSVLYVVSGRSGETLWQRTRVLRWAEHRVLPGDPPSVVAAAIGEEGSALVWLRGTDGEVLAERLAAPIGPESWPSGLIPLKPGKRQAHWVTLIQDEGGNKAERVRLYFLDAEFRLVHEQRRRVQGNTETKPVPYDADGDDVRDEVVWYNHRSFFAVDPDGGVSDPMTVEDAAGTPVAIGAPDEPAVVLCWSLANNAGTALRCLDPGLKERWSVRLPALREQVRHSLDWVRLRDKRHDVLLTALAPQGGRQLALLSGRNGELLSRRRESTGGDERVVWTCSGDVHVPRAVSSRKGRRYLAVVANDGRAWLLDSELRPVWEARPFRGERGVLAVGDLDGDGADELVVGERERDRLVVLRPPLLLD